MPFLRFRIRTLMLCVAYVGLVLAGLELLGPVYGTNGVLICVGGGFDLLLFLGVVHIAISQPSGHDRPR